MKFVELEVKPVRDLGSACEIVDDDADADFFSIYGRDERGFAHCVGDFADRNSAEQIMAALQNG